MGKNGKKNLYDGDMVSEILLSRKPAFPIPNGFSAPSPGMLQIIDNLLDGIQRIGRRIQVKVSPGAALITLQGNLFLPSGKA